MIDEFYPFVGTAWLHIKTNHIYVVLGHCMIEATMQNGVLYRRIDGTGPQWARPADEFLDGRFGEVNAMSLEARPASLPACPNPQGEN